jgi:hypothetical protein
LQIRKNQANALFFPCETAGTQGKKASLFIEFMPCYRRAVILLPANRHGLYKFHTQNGKYVRKFSIFNMISRKDKV